MIEQNKNSQTSQPEDTPSKTGGHRIAKTVGALVAAIGIGAAAHHQVQTGADATRHEASHLADAAGHNVVHDADEFRHSLAHDSNDVAGVVNTAESPVGTISQLPPQDETYVVKSGDTPMTIANAEGGIFTANPDNFNLAEDAIIGQEKNGTLMMGQTIHLPQGAENGTLKGIATKGPAPEGQIPSAYGGNSEGEQTGNLANGPGTSEGQTVGNGQEGQTTGVGENLGGRTNVTTTTLPTNPQNH